MLPTVRYNAQKYQCESVPLYGLNRSSDVKDGEFSAQTNISDRKYPFLAPRLPRAAEKYTDPTALFAWDGKEIVADGGFLLYDGESLCAVTAGEKQFAVVNTQLVVWPDKIIVDLTNKKVTRMESTVSNRGNATFAASSLTLASKVLYATASAGSWRSGFHDPVTTLPCFPWVWTYGSVDWDESSGWTITDPKMSWLGSFDIKGRYYIPEVTYNEATGSYSFKTLPHSDEWCDSTAAPPFADPGAGNNIGFYGKLKIDSGYTSIVEGELSYVYCSADYYWAQQENNTDLTTLFRVGDRVTVSEAANAANNQKMLTVSAVSANQIQVKNGSFVPGTDTGAVTVTRDAPALDFICESSNRLWGVSNRDKIIYASALGDPLTFYDYSGEETDSYALAVGSEGDFTAICGYDNGVLCWKERTLHKMLGDYPSNYQMVTYRFTGVRAGAHKSLVNLNEVLFYLGTDGVYAYSGNAPTLVSRALGEDVLKQGVGGTDGRLYYLSAETNGAWELLTYDSRTGIWTRSDDTRVLDFCRVYDKVKFLAGDTVYTIGGGTQPVSWEAVLTPFYEALQGKKQYNKLIFRLKIPAGAWAAADIRFDGGPWKQVGLINGRTENTVLLPVPLRRCDKCEVRIRGKGDCEVLGLLREFKMRGER